MDDVNDLKGNTLPSSIAAPVKINQEAKVTDSSNLDLLDETKSGNKSENLVLENPESASLGPTLGAEPNHDKPEVLHPRTDEEETVIVSVTQKLDSSPSEDAKNGDMGKVMIDTAAPFESVKAAVSKFGGIVDWKAHKVQTVEKHKFIQQELDRAHEDIPIYKQQSQSAEEAKILALKELDSTKRLIEQLKLNLERAHTEEQQAKQDAELAKLRAQEMEQGIHNDASVAAKAQLEVARARHETAVVELKSVKEELEQLRKDYDSLVAEKDVALKKAEAAALALKEVEKAVEELTIELISTKELLELAHAAHLEAEEKKAGASMARDQDNLNWDKDLKEAGEELERLNKKILSSKELKSKQDDASSLLKDLKAKLEAYMESKTKEENGEGVEKTHPDMQKTIELAKKDLEEVSSSIEKATNEVNVLKAAATSSNLELEEAKSEISNIKKREGMASITVSSLEAELSRIKSEIDIVQTKENDARQRMIDLPKELQEAAQEADVAKLAAQAAREELDKATEEAEQAKAEVSTMESKLLAAKKEIEAAKASENLALSAINAMKKTEQNEDKSSGVVLSLEEYYRLSKTAHEAEQEADVRVNNAAFQIQVAKESELKSLKRLEEVNKELVLEKENMETAVSKADVATEGKLVVEQELRKWRAKHEQRRKADEIAKKTNAGGETEKQAHLWDGSFDGENSSLLTKPPISVDQGKGSKENLLATNSETDSFPEVKTTKKKKKSLIPRIFMFLGRLKKAQAGKAT